MRRMCRLAGVIVVALMLTAQPAQAVTRTAVAVVTGTGTISTDPFTGDVWITAVGTATGVFDDLPGTCSFTLTAQLSGSVRYRGPGQFSCTGGAPFSVSMACPITADMVGTVLIATGECTGTARGPLALTLHLGPTSILPTTSFAGTGTLTVGMTART